MSECVGLALSEEDARGRATNAERGLADAWTEERGRPRTTALSNRLADVVAWETLVKLILRLPEHRAPGTGGWKGGRPACLALTMLKCVMLVMWFG